MPKPTRHERIAKIINKDLGLPKAGNEVTAELVKNIERGDRQENHPVHAKIIALLKRTKK